MSILPLCLRNAVFARPPLRIPGGAIGAWYFDKYTSALSPLIPNSMALTQPTGNLQLLPRRQFAGWSNLNTVSTDSVATAPDGSNDASTVVGTGSWECRKATNLTAGTYTIAVNVKRNTGSDQSFKIGFAINGLSTTKTATSSWQRFSFTSTLPSGLDYMELAFTSSSNIQVCDFELYAGSSDLGPETKAGHLYVGYPDNSVYPTSHTGYLDFSNGSLGIAQFPSGKTYTNITAMGLVKRVSGDGTEGDYILGEYNAPQTNFLLSQSAVNNAYGPIGYYGGVNSEGGGLVQGDTTTAGLGQCVFANFDWKLMTLRYDGTYMQIWIDDVQITKTTVSPSPVVLADFIISALAASNLSKFSIAFLAMWDRALSNAEIYAAVKSIRQRSGTSGINYTSSSRIYAADGDSITAAEQSFAYQYMQTTSYPAVGPNFGVPGCFLTKNTDGTTNGGISGRGTIVDSMLPVDMTDRGAVLSVLNTNDMLGPYTVFGGSQATYLTALSTYLDARRAAGWKVVLCTILPRGNSGFNTARNSTNTILRTWVGTHCDAIADFAADATMGPDSAYTNPTYYPDGVHPSIAGHAILAGILKTAADPFH